MEVNPGARFVSEVFVWCLFCQKTEANVQLNMFNLTDRALFSKQFQIF